MKKLASLFLSVLLVTLSCTSVYSVENKSEIKNIPIIKNDYQIFLDNHSNVPHGDDEVEFIYDENNSNNCTVKNNYLGRNGILTNTGSFSEWKATIKKEGLYAIKVDYVPENERGSIITRNILINNEIQHSGAQNAEFDRLYISKKDDIGKIDSQNVEIRPSQIEEKQWITKYIKDSQGYYSDPYLFYFKKGENTIKIDATNEPMTIWKIVACAIPEILEYSKVKLTNKDKQLANTDTIFIEAEKSDYKSTPVLFPKHDRSSPITSPNDPNVKLLNSIGGSAWSIPGQYITWKFDVKKAGLYKIYIKAKQNYNRDFRTSRTFYIDGMIPCKELSGFEFEFNKNWQLVELGNKDGAFEFYLDEGQHELKIEASLGRITEKTREVQEILYKLNEIYTDIMIITGSTPDKMRDYRLDTLIPTITSDMSKIADELQGVYDWIKAYGGRGKNTGALETSISQLRKFSKNADLIAKQLPYFKTNNGALADWLITAREQPLELDYIALTSVEKSNLPKPNAGFCKQTLYSISDFFHSFTNNYSSLGTKQDTSKSHDSIKVWIPSGRDQAQVLRKMIDSSFAEQNNINVDLQLVSSGALLPATVAGIGPDVALNMGDSEPVNYALRNAVIDLTQFSDYDEVAKRFLPERMKPMTFNNKVYALPETQGFNVLFYRKDILQKLNIEVPKTWDDVIRIIPILSNNNMSFAMPPEGTGSYFTLLLQNGGTIYKNEGQQTNLDSEIGLKSFKQWTNFYLYYGLPTEYNFLARFRTGESPIIISGFGEFNSLILSAPEIKGLWSFTLIPGTQKSDGTIDHSTPIGGNDCFILKDSKNYDASWEFIKWWTSADSQVNYGKELESLLGPSARYATANIEAFGRIPWDYEFYNVLAEQMKWGRGVEEVPGGYFIGRHINNAFRSVTLSKTDAKDTLFDYVYVINQEIKGKRKEFRLPVNESN